MHGPAAVVLTVVAIPGEVRDDDLALLGDEERRHVDRMRAEAARTRSVATRAAMHRAVGRLLGRDPSQVVVGRGREGQPVTAGCYLSAAHAGDVGLVALSVDAPVGVDVELLAAHAGEPTPRMLARLAADERARLAALVDTDRHAAFLRMWTAKEAVLKAIGCGLGVPLDAVVVELDPLRVHAGGIDTRCWSVATADPRPGVVATVAAAARRMRLTVEPAPR